jgi:hypothetical protein
MAGRSYGQAGTRPVSNKLITARHGLGSGRALLTPVPSRRSDRIVSA